MYPLNKFPNILKKALNISDAESLSSDDVPGAALFNNETNYKFKFNLK